VKLAMSEALAWSIPACIAFCDANSRPAGSLPEVLVPTAPTIAFVLVAGEWSLTWRRMTWLSFTTDAESFLPS